MTGVLLSFHYNRDTDVNVFPAHVPIFADSGAFSAANTGIPINLGDYMTWLAQWRHRITTAATLDVIGDPVATAANTARLHDAGFDVLPVFHIGTPMRVLVELCRHHRYIALGGMVEKKREADALMRWLAACFRIAREHGTVFHGFGQTRVGPLATLPFYSVDSSAWTACARYGNLKLWDGQSRIRHVYVGNPVRSPELRTLARSYGLDPDWIGTPGFGLLSQRIAEERRLEYDTLDDVSAMSWHRFSGWLAERHRVPPPPGHTRSGTLLYLADYLRPALIRVASSILTTDPTTSARVP